MESVPTAKVITTCWRLQSLDYLPSFTPRTITCREFHITLYLRFGRLYRRSNFPLWKVCRMLCLQSPDYLFLLSFTPRTISCREFCFTLHLWWTLPEVPRVLCDFVSSLGRLYRRSSFPLWKVCRMSPSVWQCCASKSDSQRQSNAASTCRCAAADALLLF